MTPEKDKAMSSDKLIIPDLFLCSKTGCEEASTAMGYIESLQAKVVELEGLLRGANQAIDTRQAYMNELEVENEALHNDIRECLAEANW